MIAVWMLYCMGIGLTFVVVGYALEKGLHLAGRSTRGAWVVALVGSYIVPVAAWVRPDAFATFPLPISLAVASAPDGSTASTSTTSTIFDPPPSRSLSLTDLDGPLRWGWGAGSAVLLLALGIATTRLVSARRRWRKEAVDGRVVLVSRNVGPAVVGVWSPRVVLPEWALSLPASDRELMLAHEEQHLRAADPALLACGFVLVMFAPWNLALWWQWRRLRLAVEMDCDARVLADGRSAPAYGELLLHVGRRRSTQLVGAAAFGEPVSFLEARIRRMLTGMPRWRWVGALGALVVAVGALVGACETPRPVGPARDLVGAPGAPAAGITGVVSAVIEPGDIDQPPVVLSGGATSPDLLRLAGIEGLVVVQARIEPDGRLDRSSVAVIQSPHPALAQAAKGAVLRSLFRPAQSKGRAVGAVVHVAYDFMTTRSAIQQPTRDLVVQGAGVSSAHVRPLLTRYFGPNPARLRDSAVIAWFVVNEPGAVVAWGKSPLTAPLDVLKIPQMAYRVIPGFDTLRVVSQLLQADRDLPPTIVVRLGDPPQTVRASPPLVSTGISSADDLKRMQTRADRARHLARRYHPEAFVRPQPNAAIALVMDLQDRVLGHATGIRVPGEESCLDVLTGLLPQFRNAQWLVSGCIIDGDAQGKVVVYWGTLLKR